MGPASLSLSLSWWNVYWVWDFTYWMREMDPMDQYPKTDEEWTTNLSPWSLKVYYNLLVGLRKSFITGQMYLSRTCNSGHFIFTKEMFGWFDTEWFTFYFPLCSSIRILPGKILSLPCLLSSDLSLPLFTGVSGPARKIRALAQPTLVCVPWSNSPWDGMRAKMGPREMWKAVFGPGS